MTMTMTIIPLRRTPMAIHITTPTLLVVLFTSGACGSDPQGGSAAGAGSGDPGVGSNNGPGDPPGTADGDSGDDGNGQNSDDAAGEDDGQDDDGQDDDGQDDDGQDDDSQDDGGDSDGDDAPDDDDDEGDAEGTPPPDKLLCRYRTLSENNVDGTFEGEVTLANINKEYVWNGFFFTIWSVDFHTTSTIHEAETPGDIPIVFEQVGDRLSFDMTWQSDFPLDTEKTFLVRGTKKEPIPYPIRCTPKYIRGDISYPIYEDLPSTWTKGMVDIEAGDLVKNPSDYYQENVAAEDEGIFIYDPVHNTQLLLGEPKVVDNAIVNGYDELRIFIPSSDMAMAMAFNHQWFGFNPNYFCALGTKENFACGLVPKTDSSVSEHYVELDGQIYHWYIQFASTDGPFQHENGNFSDIVAFFPDYFPEVAPHDSYIAVSGPEDVKWITAAISAGFSSVVNRETYWASPKNAGGYKRLIRDGADPWAELAVMTYTYNRGPYSICGTGLFENIDTAVLSTDVINDYNLKGVAEHVPTIKAITQTMNAAVDNRYDTPLTINDIRRFFDAIRTFYGRDVPDNGQWTAMMDDVERAFYVLAEHWGDDTIRYRYDFLTLLRVAQKHLPKPLNPRPTSRKWRERVNQFPC